MAISPTSNKLAKLEALEEGLKLCHQLGLSKLIIKGDSQIILNVIRNRATPNWVLNSKLEEVITLIDRFEEIMIFHIYREGNQKVDTLANKGVDGFKLMEIRDKR